MILYHGSNRTVTEPKLQTDAAKKELGSGFYLTPDSAQAAAAARTRVRRGQRLLGDSGSVMASCPEEPAHTRSR